MEKQKKAEDGGKFEGEGEEGSSRGMREGAYSRMFTLK
jgi:hypothetical protein